MKNHPFLGGFSERKVLNELLIIAKGERSLRSLRMTSQKKGRWASLELHQSYSFMPMWWRMRDLNPIRAAFVNSLSD